MKNFLESENNAKDFFKEDNGDIFTFNISKEENEAIMLISKGITLLDMETDDNKIKSFIKQIDKIMYNMEKYLKSTYGWADSVDNDMLIKDFNRKYE